MIAWSLGVIAAVLLCLYWRERIETRRLQRELDQLTRQLEAAIRRLAELETSSKSGDLFKKAVAVLIGLGVPGLILLCVMATTGLYGAAAITTALAALGGPLGMLGGIGTLVAMGITAKALAEYGFPKLAEAVVQGLKEKGESRQSILKTVNSIPRWVLPVAARSKIYGVLEDGNRTSKI